MIPASLVKKFCFYADDITQFLYKKRQMKRFGCVYKQTNSCQLTNDSRRARKRPPPPKPHGLGASTRADVSASLLFTLKPHLMLSSRKIYALSGVDL